MGGAGAVGVSWPGAAAVSALVAEGTWDWVVGGSAVQMKEAARAGESPRSLGKRSCRSSRNTGPRPATEGERQWV